MAQEKWSINGEKVIDVDGVSRLKVALVAGQINIIGHDEPGVRVEVHSVTGKDLLVKLDGETLEIDHPQLRWDNFVEVFGSFRGSARAELSIRVPRGVSLTFGVVSASALISGLTAGGSISTISGDIVIDGLCGELQLNAVNGELSVRNHEGSINAHTISADLTASGAVSKLTADTVTGDVFLDLEGVPDEVRLNTVSGNATVRLASGLAVRYRINSVSGRVQIDDSEIRGVRGGYVGSYGALDEHWLDFAANTVSGRVSVLHQVSA